MQVTYFFRKPQPGYHSIERVFDLVINNLPHTVQPTIYKLKNGDKGLLPRIKALWEIWKNRGTINHITGDISYVALVLPKKRLVITFHDLESLVRKDAWRNTLLRWLWVKLPAKRAQKVTVISEYTKQQLIKWTGIREQKVVVIPNPLPDGFVYTPKEFNEEEPEILVIGTKYNKNLEGTIQALEGLRSRLVIVGKLSGGQRELLEQKKINYQNYVGISEGEMIARYKGCDMLCFPSFFEGFGMPIIEAQATGRPVITSNYGAMKEVAGEGAFLVNPNNLGEIRKGVERMLGDEVLRHQLIERGLKNVEKYDPCRVATGYGNIYTSVVSSLL